MNYERITPKDLVEAINIPQGEDMTRILRYIHRLWELENAIERGELVKVSPAGKMTDLEKYLSKWLLNSGEDCCSRCSFRPTTDDGALCDNLKNQDGLDDDVCLNGLKEYVEKHAGQK